MYTSGRSRRSFRLSLSSFCPNEWNNWQEGRERERREEKREDGHQLAKLSLSLSYGVCLNSPPNPTLSLTWLLPFLVFLEQPGSKQASKEGRKERETDRQSVREEEQRERECEDSELLNNHSQPVVCWFGDGAPNLDPWVRGSERGGCGRRCDDFCGIGLRAKVAPCRGEGLIGGAFRKRGVERGMMSR